MSKSDMDETFHNLCLRADAYKLLAECYHAPDQKLMQEIRDGAQNNPFWTELCARIPSAADLESLQIDYAQLFLGPFRLTAPPYGSLYLENDKFMGDSTVDVKKVYEDEDLAIVMKDAPDHIAIELEFMYYLVVKQTQAVHTDNLAAITLCLQKQYSFLFSHLSRWVRPFAEKVQANAQTHFYQKVAKLTKQFIAQDLTRLMPAEVTK